MKCYVLYLEAYSGYTGRQVMSNVLKVFANKELGENYIYKTWPEAQKNSDDEFGEYWEIRPNKYFEWRAIYRLLEMEIEGL